MKKIFGNLLGWSFEIYFQQNIFLKFSLIWFDEHFKTINMLEITITLYYIKNDF